MSDCCNQEKSPATWPRRHTCPKNGQLYKEVSEKTILHHLKSPWQWLAKQQGYYYCEDPECDVVYFSGDDSVLTHSELRTRVGIKEESEDAALCYCFGVTVADYAADPELKNYVVAKTREQVCACDIRNPSGRCCLKDFPDN